MKETSIKVHVIKGFHVPVRNNVFKQVSKLKMNENPYGSKMNPGPTARMPPALLSQ